jgi:hypothetical protein
MLKSAWKTVAILAVAGAVVSTARLGGAAWVVADDETCSTLTDWYGWTHGETQMWAHVGGDVESLPPGYNTEDEALPSRDNFHNYYALGKTAVHETEYGYHCHCDEGR